MIELYFIQTLFIFVIVMLLISISDNYSMLSLSLGINFISIMYLVVNLDMSDMVNIFFVMLFMLMFGYGIVRFMVLKDGDGEA